WRLLNAASIDIGGRLVVLEIEGGGLIFCGDSRTPSAAGVAAGLRSEQVFLQTSASLSISALSARQLLCCAGLEFRPVIRVKPDPPQRHERDHEGGGYIRRPATQVPRHAGNYSPGTRRMGPRVEEFARQFGIRLRRNIAKE